MISSFQAALKNAVDVVAPPATALDDFTYHWKQLMNFYVNHLTNCKLPIEATNIPHHLDRLLDILFSEENALDSENPGPCLEYLLQHRLLDLLATLASAEAPPGMRFVCLFFLRRLLTRLQHPLLPHVSVYTPVQRLIALCNGSLASPTENEEIQFLVALCFLICKHPNLTYIMNNVRLPPQKPNALASSGSNKLETQQITYAPTRTRNNSNPLFEPLDTQAVTLINPDLHKCESRRKLSSKSSQCSLRSENSERDLFSIVDRQQSTNSDTIVMEHKRKISNYSNASLSSDEVDSASPQSSAYFKKTDCGSFLSANEMTCKYLKNSSNGSANSLEEIDSKLQDLRELQIQFKSDSPFTAASSELDKAEANFKFFENISKTTRSEFDSASDISTRNKSLQSPADTSLQIESSKCLLLDALISYLNSADNMVRVKACEGVMVLASLQDSRFARSVANSQLPFALSNRLEKLFNLIPAHVDPTEIDEVNVTWGLDSPLWTSENKFPGCRPVAAFFMWLDYCDQLTREAHAIVGEILAENIRVMFFQKILTPALSDHHVVLITALITKCLKEITSPYLNAEINYWLVGFHRDPELPGILPSPVVHQLIKNCYTDSDDLTLETLRLFEEMIERRHEHILHCLILTYLTSRGYYDNSAADSAIASWSDEEDEREKSRGTLDLSSKQNYSRTLAPSNIHRIINCFLTLLPRSLQSDLDANNYEQYMTDWEKQYSSILAECALLSWPLEAVTIDDTASSDSRPEADHCTPRFYPGPFLTMLFEKVTKIPSQKYEINLQLTVLVSRLALLPHPYVHEYLLNPLLPLTPGTPSLFGCLQQVVKHLASEVPKVPDYKRLLKDTRQKLLDDSVQSHMKENILLDSVVITEEFCKELAAIAYVKYHRSM
ncbi:FHF complex subunit HOOK interacting protein 2A isoform X1 [Neodiprion lecontei]|uniref:FHF complex subunit HOOK interacting protein 2A isoform X1 n=1 Tax=Neodiprion lecontei TaxID=441921 RepID=A0A6J0C486_NEOLC|nr:FHF complex subunit HOOK interacting protein 2A isoform X1 [Neodiprion lecontei]